MRNKINVNYKSKTVSNTKQSIKSSDEILERLTEFLVDMAVEEIQNERKQYENR